MGLDIACYSKVSLYKEADDAEDDLYMTHAYVYLNPDFPGREDGLVQGWYTYEDSLHFQAGSYSGYNIWRDQLSCLALGVTPEVVWKNTDRYRGQRCFELINFSDCEGSIGPKTSEKIYRDLIQVRAFHDGLEDPHFVALLDEWLRGMALAADNGLCNFT